MWVAGGGIAAAEGQRADRRAGGRAASTCCSAEPQVPGTRPGARWPGGDDGVWTAASSGSVPAGGRGGDIGTEVMQGCSATSVGLPG